jgi:hypothetical protein
VTDRASSALRAVVLDDGLSASTGERALPARAEAERLSTLAEVERLQEAIRSLVAERQALHEREAGGDQLESNRLEISRRQRQLSRALVDHYWRRPEQDAA